MPEFVLPSPLVHNQHLHAVSILGMKGISLEAELRPKLQMVAFEVVELHSSALRDKKSESGGFHNVARKRAYDADDRRNYSNVFQYFWLRPASDVIKSDTLKHTSLIIEHGVVEVDESKDDSAIDSKGTAVLRIVPTTISGLL